MSCRLSSRHLFSLSHRSCSNSPGDLISLEKKARIFGVSQKASNKPYHAGQAFKAALKKRLGFSRLHKFPYTYAALGVDDLPVIGGDLIFGIHSVRQALLANHRLPKRLFIKHSDSDSSVEREQRRAAAEREILVLARNKGVPVVSCTSPLLHYLVPDRTHQGVALEASRLHPQQWMDVKAAALAELRGSHPTRLPLWVFMDRILDPMNVGSILRSAFYFGAGEE